MSETTEETEVTSITVNTPPYNYPNLDDEDDMSSLGNDSYHQATLTIRGPCKFRRMVYEI